MFLGEGGRKKRWGSLPSRSSRKENICKPKPTMTACTQQRSKRAPAAGVRAGLRAWLRWKGGWVVLMGGGESILSYRHLEINGRKELSSLPPSLPNIAERIRTPLLPPQQRHRGRCEHSTLTNGSRVDWDKKRKKTRLLHEDITR